MHTCFFCWIGHMTFGCCFSTRFGPNKVSVTILICTIVYVTCKSQLLSVLTQHPTVFNMGFSLYCTEMNPWRTPHTAKQGSLWKFYFPSRDFCIYPKRQSVVDSTWKFMTSPQTWFWRSICNFNLTLLKNTVFPLNMAPGARTNF